MPLQLDELTEREQPASDDVRADERLEHARRVGTWLARVVDAEQRHASGELGIGRGGADAFERRVEVVTLEVADAEVERVLRICLDARDVSAAASPTSGSLVSIAEVSACSSAHCSEVTCEA